LIREGNVEKANYLLGRNYTIQGSVVRGLGNGMKMGFPTSNLKLDANYVVPPLGVYATISQFDDETVKRFSMTDIGFHPTIDRLKTISIETNIFGISKETYGRHLKLEFIKYIRPEMKFNTLNDLICQLGKDKSSIEKYFSNKKD
jgi:riboflavin kinase/FMN adenylyltransferase